nr:MAG TPA: cytochrome c protein [Bacteriophage sp.]
MLCFVCHGKFTILFVFFILFSKSQIKSHGLLSNTLMYYKRL